MKHLFTALLVTFLSLFTIAQDLHVVKDNINCTYGIKDQEGNWVVEAKFILIEEYNTGYFLMRDEIGVGIFTPQGKQLIPCIHDNIEISVRYWRLMNPYGRIPKMKEVPKQFYFYGINRNGKTIYNFQGEKVLEFSADSEFKVDSDFSILAYDRGLRYTKYVDSTGEVILDSIPGRMDLFRETNYAVIGDRVSDDGRASGNARVVNRKGEFILNTPVDRAMIDSKNRICFYNDRKYGVLSTSGDTIIAPLYKRMDGQFTLESTDFWVISDEKGQAGLMKNTGWVLVEPQYDNLYQIKAINPDEIAWMVEKDGRFGVLDSYGTELIPMKYDQLYPINFIWGNYRKVTTRYIGIDKGKHYYLNHQGIESVSEAYDSLFPIVEYNYGNSPSLTRGVISKRNGKYGLLNPDGSELTPCIYDLRHEISRDRYLMGQDGRLTEYNFVRNLIRTNDWQTILSSAIFNVYAFQNRYITISKSMETGQTGKIISNLQSFQRYGDLLIVQESDSRNWLFFNLKTQKKLPLKNIANVNSSRNGQFAVFTQHGNHGIIDEDGKMILDTIYKNISFDQRSTKIWATKIVENRYVSVLLDSVGRQVIPNQFDASFDLNNGDQIVSQNQKKGLIDSETLRWKIRPEHFCLIKLFDGYYYTGNKLNKKGVIKDDGATVIPVIYDTLILLYSNCRLNGLCPKDEQRKVYWIARQGNVEYLIDQDGRRYSSKAVTMTLKSKLFFADDTTMSAAYRYSSFPTLDYSPSLHFLRGLTMEQIQEKRKALWESSILKKEVLDTINRIWSARVPTCGQNYSWGAITLNAEIKSSQLEDQARKSCQCFQSSRYNYGNYLVYQLRSIGPKFVTIDISHQNQNRGWDHLRSQAPPPIPGNQHINIVEENGKARYLTLKDVFPDDDILMQEFIEALKQRDDLKLQCSSLENMLEMINGSFSLSDEGVILYLNQNQYNHYSNAAVELLIPIENLIKLAESKWIVPFLQE